MEENYHIRLQELKVTFSNVQTVQKQQILHFKQHKKEKEAEIERMFDVSLGVD